MAFAFEDGKKSYLPRPIETARIYQVLTVYSDDVDPYSGHTDPPIGASLPGSLPKRHHEV